MWWSSEVFRCASSSLLVYVLEHAFFFGNWAGGIAGLSAAIEAHKQGASVTLVEAEEKYARLNFVTWRRFREEMISGPFAFRLGGNSITRTSGS